MTKAYIFFGALVLFHLSRLLYFYYQRRRGRKTEVEIADFRWAEYLKLREEALAVTPEKLGLELPQDTETAFGIAHELHYGTAVYFIIIFKTGEVWVFSSENAKKEILVKADNEPVMKIVAAAFDTAEYNFARMQRKFTAVLEPGHIKFHILTNIDVYSTNSFIGDIQEENFEWEELWEIINQVIEEIEYTDVPSKPITVYWKRRQSSRKNL